MSFITSIPTSNIPIRQSLRLRGIFEPEFPSPFLRILAENLIHPDSNPLMEKKYFHSSHDEDDALRVPPEQVQKNSNELDKMGNWLL